MKLSSCHLRKAQSRAVAGEGISDALDSNFWAIDHCAARSCVV